MVSATNKTDRHHMTEILLKVTLNTITLIITVKIYHDSIIIMEHVLLHTGKFVYIVVQI
jgi:hypothetical protein